MRYQSTPLFSKNSKNLAFFGSKIKAPVDVIAGG